MKIELWLKNTNFPRIYHGVKSTYEEGSFLCVLISGKIHKYPVNDIFRVVEILAEEENV